MNNLYYIPGISFSEKDWVSWRELMNRDVVSVSTSRSRDGLETIEGLVLVSSRACGKRLGLVSVSGAKVSVLASVSTV